MRSEKIQLVKEIGDALTGSDFLFFVSYKGMKVKDFTELRVELDKQKAQCHVLKNSLVRKAAELSGLNVLAKADLKGDTAVIYGKGDVGLVAKTIDTFFKTRENLGAKGGYFEGSMLSKGEVKDIASMPSKEVMYAQLLGVLQAPSRNLVSVLNNKAASILNVLSAYKDKLEKETK